MSRLYLILALVALCCSPPMDAAAAKKYRKLSRRAELKLPRHRDVVFELAHGERLFTNVAQRNTKLTRLDAEKQKVYLKEGRSSFPEGSFMYVEARAGNELLGYARYKPFAGPQGKTMLFDVVVRKKYRGLGLYHTLFGHALAQTPDTARSPILLYEGTNLKVFRESAFPTPPTMRAFKLRRLEKMTPSERQNLRQSLIDAAEKMPAAKVRKAKGIGEIASLRFNPHRNALIVDFTRPGAAGEPKVFMSDFPTVYGRDRSAYLFNDRPIPVPSVYELKRGGELEKTKFIKDWLVGGYDQSMGHHWADHDHIP